MTDENDEFHALEEIARRHRRYASMREGGTKTQKELTTVRDLFQSMEAAGVLRYRKPFANDDDPPDCIAFNSSDERVAFEVSEFVSQEAIELNERVRPGPDEPLDATKTVMARWDRSSLLLRIDDILRSKDRKTFRGGPFAETIVVIHTDEPLLVRPECEAWLEGKEFGPFQQITAAYMLFPYEPKYGYPYKQIVGAA